MISSYLFASGNDRPSHGLGGGHNTHDDIGRKCRILVVDDDDLFRVSVMLELKRRFDADVQPAKARASAIAMVKAAAGSLDLILLDVRLFGPRDGLAVYEAIRADGVETPVIFMSAYYNEDDRAKIEAWGETILKKPLIDYGKIELVLSKCRGDAS